MSPPFSLLALQAHLQPIRRVLLLVLTGFLAAPLAQAQKQSAYEPQVVVVQFEPDVAVPEGAAKTSLDVFDRMATGYGVYAIERMFPFLDHVQPTPKTAQNLAALRRTYYVRYSADDDPGDVAKVLMTAPGVTYTEPHAAPVPAGGRMRPDVIAEPDDPFFRDQAHLKRMRLPDAWEIVKGEDMNPPVVIAITDTGVDWRHEDLLGNVWTNADEIPDNGIDDDNNGFVDDVHGVDVRDSDDRDNDPDDPGDNLHGTAVSGAAGAVTDNGVGIAGTAWNARLMHIRGFYEGILYAAANGADIINTSWFTQGAQRSTAVQVLDLAMDMGALVVAAAANDGLNMDELEQYPPSHPRVLTVGATVQNSRIKAEFSNYGKGVDVFAPGTFIYTAKPDDAYGLFNGTSLAAPLVSGVAALVKTRYPDISPGALRERIRLSSENMDAKNPDYAGLLGRGYVNAEAALQTPVFPAIRVERWSWTDSDGDKQIAPGEEVTITATVVNYLADARQLSIGLTAAEAYPYIDLSTTEQTIGRLASGDSTEVTLRFAVSADTPANRRVRLYTRIRDGAFVDEPDQFVFTINTRLDEIHAALSALYVSTNGNRWNINFGWDIATVPSLNELSRWYGVLVQQGLIDQLRLPDNNLTGMLPGELGELSSLTALYLERNALVGEIPAELGNLSQLRWLYLQGNDLTGRLPRSLMQLEKLQDLRFGGQDLCAPADDAFQEWLGGIPEVRGRTCRGIHFIDNAPDQSFARARAIIPLVLPEAIGGASPIDYTLTPALPEALSFDHATRTISGTPPVVTPPTVYTYKATDANGAADSLTFTIEVISPVGAEDESLPQAFVLHGNYPNPFQHSTRLTFDLPWPARVTVEVTDVTGRRVHTAPAVDLSSGWNHSIELTGATLSSGLYLYRVHASSPRGNAVHAGRFVRIR